MAVVAVGDLRAKREAAAFSPDSMRKILGFCRDFYDARPFRAAAGIYGYITDGRKFQLFLYRGDT
jgi:hypothetical protein